MTPQPRQSEERGSFAVAAFRPFWRWAVCPGRAFIAPGIPYYRKADALEFYDDAVRHFPGRPPLLLRRTGWLRRTVEVVDR